MSGKILLRTGKSIAYQQWGASNTKKILAVHGWLDNSNSYSFLGPHLANLGYHVFAIDLMGHGRSSHFSADGTYTYLHYLSSIREVVDSIGWANSAVIGHSMGASVATCFAAAFPERVDSIVMIDGFGPYTRPASSALSYIRQRLEFDNHLASKSAKGRKSYATLNDAVATRIKNVASFPGKQYISQEAAYTLVSRGSVPLSEDPDTFNEDLTDLSIGPVTFRHDLGLMRPSLSYLTHDQAMSILNGIACPTVLIAAEHGWPPGNPAENQEKLNILIDKGLLLGHHIVPDSSHHLHLDPSSRGKVADIVTDFYSKIENASKVSTEVKKEPLEFYGE